jgi:predicted TIM-barrel fold metal-dependent hydrolase
VDHEPTTNRPTVDGAAAAEIDLHCHVFNVRDIPAYAYIEDVFLQNGLVRVIAAPMVLLATQTARRKAPDYRREKKALQGGPVALGREPDDDASAFAEGLIDFVDRHTSFGRDPDPSGKLENDRFVVYLFDLFLPELVTPDFTTESIGAAIKDPNNARRLFHSMQGSLATAATNVRGYVAQFLAYFAVRVARFRFQLRDELATVFTGVPDVPRLLTPATLDLGHWLPSARGDAATTTLAEQSELMRLIALRPGPALMHGFIAFDPYRYVDDVARGTHPNALEVVETALTRDGFIGVKLYPPMGFRATDNASLADGDFPPALTRAYPHLGRRLDDALAALYACCIDHDAPIMAHGAPSQGTNPVYALRADPIYWRAVLRTPKFSALRLNLGHFGGLWAFDQEPAAKRRAKGVDVAWTAFIGEMIDTERFPNVYVDVGDFAPILRRTPEEAAVLERILGNLGALAARRPKLRSRIMFGTDWLMLGIEPQFMSYAANMRARLPLALGITADDLFRKNPARYLGLAEGDRTRERLRRFYRDNGRDPAVLDPFRP